MLGDFASLDVQNTYRGSDAYAHFVTNLWVLHKDIRLLKAFNLFARLSVFGPSLFSSHPG
ncbi:hypothetical protein [Piscirickettsia salmonis]|uniref:hypothetical protein n=1 Tax=Piscirickettsia salmonis TaxID=1238 RepID=UPI003A7F8DC0